MRDTFFFTIGIAFTSGIFLRSFFDVGVVTILFVFLIAGALCIAWRSVARDSTSPLFLMTVAFCAFGVGMLRLHLEESAISPLYELEGKQVQITARIVREPEDRGTSTHLQVTPLNESKYADEQILVRVDRFVAIQNNFAYGDVVSVSGTIERPTSFATDGGRTFDYPGYLKARGVEYMIPFGDITLLTKSSGGFIGQLFALKQKSMEVIETYITEPYAGLGEGVLLGVKRAIGADLEATFRETGIIHIVVLSGYNIMIVVEFVMFLLSFWFFPRTRMVLGIIAVSLFAIMVGLSATVVRASTMAILLLIARATGHTYAVLRALVFAGVCMLCINPYLLVHDPGFQLSFLATLGLIILSPYIEKRLARVPTFVGIRSFLTATLATQITVLPLLLYHTGMFSVVAIFVNVLVLPMVTVAMLLTFLTGVIGTLTSVGGIGVGYLAYLSLKYIVTIAEFFGAFPFASISIEAFPFFLVVVAYLVLAVCIWMIARTASETPVKGTTVVNEYSGWIIEEEGAEKTSTSPSPSKSPLPFR